MSGILGSVDIVKPRRTGGGSINVGTGNVGDLVKVTDTAGTTFGRVATSTLVPTSFEDLLDASPTIIALQASSIKGRLTR